MPPSYEMSLAQTIVIAAAGPLCNVCCVAVLHKAGAPTQFTAAHLVLAALNSLPVMPLDGGQIAIALCERVCSGDVAQRLESGLFWVTWSALIVLGTAVCIHSGGNFTLLAVAVYLGVLRLFYKCD